MIRSVVVKDYGSHIMLDSIHGDERNAIIEMGRLVDQYRQNGYSVTFCSAGSIVERDKHRVTIKLQQREGFTNVSS